MSVGRDDVCGCGEDKGGVARPSAEGASEKVSFKGDVADDVGKVADSCRCSIC